MLNICDTSEPVLGLEDPIGMVERFATARDRQGLELRQWHRLLLRGRGDGRHFEGRLVSDQGLADPLPHLDKLQLPKQ